MSELRQQLCGFRMHEETPVESILGCYNIQNVFQEIDSILRTAQPEAVAHTLGFVRDANLHQHPFRDIFHEHLSSSEIWETLQSLLQAPNFGVRRDTIYTIGKLTNRNRASLLSDAFPFYLENDPINLPNLLLELLWLTNKWNWGFVEQVSVAKHYLVRWCLCCLLDDSGNSAETQSRFLGILDRLKCDSNSLVAAEALLRFERVKVKIQPKLPKAEWRKEVKRISSLQPKVTFESVAMQFMLNRSDYLLEDFDRFATGLARIH